jgi:hypothetical protein
MLGTRRIAVMLLVLLLVPALAAAVVEEKTGMEYPDTITIAGDQGEVTLVATGTALREKTILKVDVYTIVSYVAEGTDLGEDKAAGLMTAKAPKQLQMDLRRSFSREKLINAFREVIEKNYEDLTPIAADMAVFEGYFTRDAQEGDIIIFTYLPGQGLTTNLNGEDKGVITNTDFAEALWSVWLGRKPANGDMKKALVAQVK